MRRAEWRRRADDPKGLLGWWWRGVLERSFLPLLPLLAAALTFEAYPGSALVFFCAGLPLAILAQTSIASESSRLSALLAEPGPEGRFRAMVQYRRKGTALGQDAMALTAVDGWLIGEGVRSGFALRSADVERLRYCHRAGHSLLTLTDGTRLRVVGRGTETHQALIDWRIGNERPAGEPAFPPARAHPQEVARWAAWSIVGMGLIFLPIPVASFLHLGARLSEVRLALWISGLVTSLWAWPKAGRLIAISVEAARRDILVSQTLPLQEIEEIRDMSVRRGRSMIGLVDLPVSLRGRFTSRDA